MKKKKIIFLTLLVTLVYFTISLVSKPMQNDTFFYIPIGERIAKTHIIDGLDHWSFHENLRFTYPGWICNLIMYLVYNSFGFRGIYILVIILSGIIASMFFCNLLAEKHNIIFSFIVSLFAMYCSGGVFAARNQIFSFLIFELEIFCLIGLLERGKKKYFWLLILLAFLLVLVHDTVYIFYIVLMLPYLADFILDKIFKIDNSYKFKSSNLQNIKYLFILVVLSVPIGFCTPIFASTYTNLINCMNGVSTSFIGELQPVNIISNTILLTITFVALGIFGFTKAKYKLKDVLFVFGFIIFSCMAGRNGFFLYLIGLIYLANMLRDFINTYIEENKVNSFFETLCNSKYLIVVICCFTSIISTKILTYKLIEDYVVEVDYPVQATEWIKENVDYENIKLWTHFNWGSYLELNGIKVFLDSRSGMYTEQENKNCTVLEDWLDVKDDNVDYKKIMKKYGITHILVEVDQKLEKHLREDSDYKAIYQDNVFVLYEKNNV